MISEVQQDVVKYPSCLPTWAPTTKSRRYMYQKVSKDYAWILHELYWIHKLFIRTFNEYENTGLPLDIQIVDLQILSGYTFLVDIHWTIKLLSGNWT